MPQSRAGHTVSFSSKFSSFSPAAATQESNLHLATAINDDAPLPVSVASAHRVGSRFLPVLLRDLPALGVVAFHLLALLAAKLRQGATKAPQLPTVLLPPRRAATRGQPRDTDSIF